MASETVSVPQHDSVAHTQPQGLGDCEGVSDTVADGEGVSVTVTDGVNDRVGVFDTEDVCEKNAVLVGERDMEDVREDDLVGDGSAVLDLDTDRVPDTDFESVRDSVSDAVSDTDDDMDRDCVRDCDAGDAETDVVAVGVVATLALTEGVSVAEAVSDGLTVGDSVSVGLTLRPVIPCSVASIATASRAACTVI
jgi:hypothetical protein